MKIKVLLLILLFLSFCHGLKDEIIENEIGNLESALELEGEIMSENLAVEIKDKIIKSGSLIKDMVDKMITNIWKAVDEGVPGDSLPAVDHDRLLLELIEEGKLMGNLIYEHANAAFSAEQTRAQDMLELLLQAIDLIMTDYSQKLQNLVLSNNVQLNSDIIIQGTKVIDLILQSILTYVGVGNDKIQDLFNQYDLNLQIE